MPFIKKINWKRFAKFSSVGCVSFVIDFLILNSLSMVLNINRGVGAASISAISFLFANYNSYFFNKRWTFKDNNLNAKYKTFLKISIIGAMANVSIIYVMTSFVDQAVFSGIVWLNISKLTATLLVALFNYISYRKFVFNIKNTSNLCHSAEKRQVNMCEVNGIYQ